MSSEARPSTPSPQQNEIRSNPLPPSPKRGEIWDVNWSPGRGAEQQGTRPALIIQNDRGNASPTYPLTIVASMSRTERELPLHVRIAPHHPGASPSARIPAGPLGAPRGLARIAFGQATD